MISSQAHDLATALAKSLGLDDQSSAETCPTNGCKPLDGSSDRKLAHLKIRVHLHDELLSLSDVDAEELPIDADPHQAVHEVDRDSDGRRAIGRRWVRTVALGVLTCVMVGAGLAWMADAEKLGSTRSPPSSKVIPVGLASKTSDRVPSQDALPTLDALPTQEALLTQDQAAPVLLPGQMSIAPGSSPELQKQLESIASDVAVVRRIVERLAAVQEQMVLDIATLQRSNQHESQKASLLPHPPAAPVPSRKYAPNIVRSTPSVTVPSAPATPLH